MPASNLLSKSEAADVLGVSERTVARNLDATPAGKARNGRAVPGYDIANLPADAQKAWAERWKVIELPIGGAPGQLALALTQPVGPNLSEEDRVEAEKRYHAIEALLERDRYPLLWAQYRTKGAMVQYLCKAHATRPRTLYNWLAAWQERGLPGLVSRDRADKGRPRAMTPASLDWLLAAALPRKGAYGVLSVKEIARAYNEERAWRAAHIGRPMGGFERDKYARYLDEDYKLCDSALLPKVSYETLRVWFERIPEIARTMAREGGEAFRNSQEILSFRDIGATMPLDYVVMDHRVLDMFCLVPTRDGWKLARPWLTAAIDMRTRKWLAWVIVETPSSDSIAAVLKRVFIDHGLPRQLYWDNGKDFRCEWLEGGRRPSHREGRVGELDGAWRGVIGTLGIRVTHAIVRNARAKLIEPNFGRISKFDETLPEFCGHKPGSRPDAFDELLKKHERWVAGETETTPFRTIHQVASLYTRVIEDLNERPLEGEGMQKVTPTGRGWMCPNEAWEILIDRVERRTVDAELLRFCFAKRRELTVKHGEVKTSFAGRDYHYRLTGNPVALMALNGQTVEFAYDQLDLGEAAIYYQDRFVGLANCTELRRMGEEGFVEDEKLRRAARREVKKFIEAVHKAVPVADPDTRLARRAEVLPAREMTPRVSAPVRVPGAIVEAEQQTREDRTFSFDDAPAALLTVERPADEDDDGEFRFFQQGE